MKQNKTTNIAAGTDVLTMQLFEPDPNILYPLEMVQHLARIPRRMILTYCRRGLISPVIDPQRGGYDFTAEAIYELRHIEILRVACGINLTGIKFILDLTKEIQRLRRDRVRNQDSMQPANSPRKEITCPGTIVSRLHPTAL